MDHIVELILIADLLDIEVVGNVCDLFFDRDDVLPVAQANAEHICQGVHQTHDILRIVVAGHPADGIQRIVEEMRLDLLLEGLHLCGPLVLLLHIDHLDQLVDARNHVVKALPKLPDFIVVLEIET